MSKCGNHAGIDEAVVAVLHKRVQAAVSKASTTQKHV